MKKYYLLLLGFSAALLSSVGAHAISNQIDPTSRGTEVKISGQCADDGGSAACMDGGYGEP